MPASVKNEPTLNGGVMFIGPCIILIIEESKTNKMQLDILYCTSYRINMFQELLCPSSGARDYNVDYHIGHVDLGLLHVGGYVRLGWSAG